MTDRSPSRRRAAVAIVWLVCAPASLAAQTAPPPPDTQDKAMARYLETARGPAATPDATLWMHGLALDLRARRVNDLLTIRVEESIVASGTADSSLTKSSSSSVAVPSLFGLETKLPSIVNPNNLASSQSDTGFTGGGSTTRTSLLTATLSARVADVLPNGDLLIEGVREIEINGDRQIVVLSGIARVVDIGPGNVVSSMSLGQLRIRYFGKGLTKNSLSPGWLVRILNKIF
jgi:flagellar L-ring protein precursor FlgH